MDSQDWLGAIGAAINGGLNTYSWAKDYELQRQKIEQDGDVKRLREEIRVMLESMKETGRNDRWSTPSANVTAQQEGQNFRTGENNATRVYLGDQRDETTRRGQDLYKEQATMRDLTSRRGQDFQFDLGVIRDNTARHGQDVTLDLGMSLEDGRNTRATAARALREREDRQRERQERLKREDRRDGESRLDWQQNPPGPRASAGLPTLSHDIELTEGTGRPTAEPVEIIEAPADDGLPVAPVRSPEAGADAMTRLSIQARALITQYRAESDPAKRAAFRRQLERVAAEIRKAQGGQ